MILISSWSRLCPILWSQVFSREWRCSWSSADRRCSNYIWVIDSLIAYWGASYIRDLMVTLIPSWVSNHMPGKVCDPTLYNGCDYLSMMGLKLCYQRGPWYQWFQDLLFVVVLHFTQTSHPHTFRYELAYISFKIWKCDRKSLFTARDMKVYYQNMGIA